MKSLDDLCGAELRALRFIRTSPHRVSLFQISSSLGLPGDRTRAAIRSLLDTGYIRQDSRDRQGGPRKIISGEIAVTLPDSGGPIEWDDDRATYYTAPSRRAAIDAWLDEFAPSG